MIRRLVPLVLAAGLAACNTSAGMFTDDMEGADSGGNAVGSLLTMSGMLAPPKPPIEYGPRAPLAMPGSTDLPTPEERSAAMEAVNFPVDQEEQNRDAVARLRAGNAALDKRMNGTQDSVDARALPGEIQATMPASKTVRTGDIRELHNNVSERDRLNRDQMKVTVRDPNRASLLNEDGTPAPRASLVVPPVAYRTPTATAALPAEKDIENSEWIAKQLYRKDERLPARMQGQPTGGSGRAPGSFGSGMAPRGY